MGLLELFSLSGLKRLLSKYWRLILVIVVIALSIVYWYHRYQKDLKEFYDKGVEAGKTQIVNEYAKKAVVLRVQNALDKERIEKDAQVQIDQARADARASRDAADSLRGTLDKVRSIAGDAGVSVAPGTSTTKAINLLADLLEQSNDRSNQYAEFADTAYEAGRTCEVQYDTLRIRINAQQGTN